MWIFSPRCRSSFSKHTLRAGFTIIELLLVVSIMAIMTTALLVRQQSFNSSTILRSLAYSVALSVRQAQTYGISVLGNGGAFSSPAYGVHLVGACGAQITNFTLFGDGTATVLPNGYYDVNDPIIRTFKLNQGYYISNFATLEKGTGQYDCMCATPTIKLGNGVTATCAVTGLKTLDVLFRRPNPDACFTVTDTNGSFINGTCLPGGSQSNYPQAFIQITAQGGAVRGVRVNTTGEIEVTNGL